MFTEKNLVCRDCEQPFTFTVPEQEEFASRGYSNLPGRCPTCLATRRSRNPAPSYGQGGGYEPRERQMFPAICADCGKATQVPFQPRADRPVYCSECFNQHRPAGDNRARAESRGGARW